MQRQLAESLLFKRLKDAEKTDGFDEGEISSRVGAIIREVSPILNQVVRHFPEYTLHDPSHSYRVLDNMGKIIPHETLDLLDSIELSTLIYAAFLHDIGMAASSNEMADWLQSDEGKTFIDTNEKWSNLLETFKNDDVVKRRLQDMTFTDYLRQHHARRGSQFLTDFYGTNGKSNNRILVREVNYADYVALVCESHCEDTMKLRAAEYRRDALVREHPLNIQYLAVVLRLADLCDLDPERTPKVVLDFINPADPKSAEEWQKHRSIRGWKISDECIRFEAKCSHPAIQRGLREWMEYIERERRDCLGIVRDNRAEITERYKLNLTEPIPTETIESDGSYVYADFEFNLDYEKIVSLLMGTQLWGSPMIALRELLQNSLDTCRHRKALSQRHNVPYEPVIRLTERAESDGKSVICEDNGMGMNVQIIEDYFMRIGRSYYQSRQFLRQNLGFSPGSEFGLGIMSCFMLTDKITVETQHLSEDLGLREEALRIDIERLGRYFVIRKGNRKEPGTTITLRGVHHPVDLRDLRWVAPHFPLDIVVSEDGKRRVFHSEPHKLPDTMELFFRHRSARPEIILRQASRYDFELRYEQTGGLQGEIALIFLRDPRGKLTWGYKEGDTEFYIDDWDGGIRYRKRGATGLEEKGHIIVLGEGQRWSQDGFRIEGGFPIGTDSFAFVKRTLKTPVACFVDIDLQGPWKLGLDVTKRVYDDRDKRFEQFRDLFYELMSDLIRQILEKEDLLPTTDAGSAFVDELLVRSGPLLAQKLKARLNYRVG